MLHYFKIERRHSSPRKPPGAPVWRVNTVLNRNRAEAARWRCRAFPLGEDRAGSIAIVADARRALPARHRLARLQPEPRHHPRGDFAHDVIDRLRLGIEMRHGRRDDGAHPREREHRLEVALVQRRLARDQHQPPPLLQHHVGRAREKVIAEAVGNRGQRAHGARHHGHRVRAEGAAGDRRAKLVCFVGEGGGLAHRGGGVKAKLVRDGDVRAAGHDQMRFRPRLTQLAQGFGGQRRARGSRDADDDLHELPSNAQVQALS